MSNPTFVQGPITFEASARIEKFTLVTIDDDGKVKPAGADTSVFGAVTEIADPSITTKPTNIAVHYGSAAVKLRASDASAFKAGAPVYAGTDGTVSTSGALKVGVAVRAGEDGKVLTVLNGLPASTPADPAGGAEGNA